MLRAALVVLVAAALALSGAAPSLAVVPFNPAPWPDQFSVRFNVSIPNFKAAQLPSELHYDWTNRRQAVIHDKCPIFSFTQCRVVFSPEGTHVIDTFGVSVCCKLADFGTIPPYLFSNFSTFNGTETVNGILTNKWNLYDHGYYFTDVTSYAPVKFQAEFPAAGIVWWDFLGPFRVEVPDEDNFKLPALCLPKCPVDPTPPTKPPM
jgi:hypothetical protein